MSAPGTTPQAPGAVSFAEANHKAPALYGCLLCDEPLNHPDETVCAKCGEAIIEGRVDA